MSERHTMGPVDPAPGDAGSSRTAAPGASELIELAHRAPEELTARLSRLPVRDQARLALQIPAKERLQVLTQAPRPMRLVRALPEIDLYLTIRELGPFDATPLLRLASWDQLQHLFDLESWRGDRFDVVRAGGWVALLLESDESSLLRLLRNGDESALALLFQQWIRIEQLEYEDGADVHGHGVSEAGTEKGYATPDGYYRFQPVVPEHTAAIRRLLQLFYEREAERYQRIVWAALWELPAELEEDALRWRQSRLEEHGFPTWDEALSAYAPPGGDRSHPRPLASSDKDALVASRLSLAQLDRETPLALALERLPTSELDRVAHGLVSLANRLMVADGADTGDPEAHRAVVRKAAGYVGVALEERAGGAPGSGSRALHDVPILELFREGYSRATGAQQEARSWVASAWPGGTTSHLDLLDTPIRERVLGLLESRPRFFEADTTGGGVRLREFESRDEIEQARLAVEMADVLGRLLVDGLKLDVARTIEANATRLHPVHFSTIVLTALAWHAARGEVRGDPVPAEVMSDFLRTVASRRTASPEAPERALERMIAELSARFELSPRDAAVAERFGRACLEQLAAECAALDPGVPVDERIVSCILLPS